MRRGADSSCMNRNMMLMEESAESNWDRLAEAAPHKQISTDKGRFCPWVRVKDSGLVQF